MTREKLADMSKHNYVTGRGGVEPNVHITPDKKWVVFTGQFGTGQRHVYAVEIERASGTIELFCRSLEVCPSGPLASNVKLAC